MLQINNRIERSSAAGLTRNWKCSKQKPRSSQFHAASLVTQNQCSWWCTHHLSALPSFYAEGK